MGSPVSGDKDREIDTQTGRQRERGQLCAESREEEERGGDRGTEGQIDRGTEGEIWSGARSF